MKTWRRVWVATVLGLGGAVPGAAEAQEDRVPAPDTLGAAFDPSVVGRGRPSDYDRFMGAWRIRFQQRREDGSFQAPVSGTWTFGKTAGGLVVEDVFSIGSGASPTVTFRIFDPSREVWAIQGAKPREGRWDPGTTWADGEGGLYVVQTFQGQMLARIRYYDVRDDRFLWRADGSLDGGKTWMIDLWRIEAVRAAPPG